MPSNKKNMRDWHGTGFVTDRGTTPLPHMGGPKGVGAEGPKRLMRRGPGSQGPIVPQPRNAAEGPKQSMPLYRDKYGRRISKEEYEKREKFRKDRKLRTADSNEKVRPPEMKRRKKYRKTDGKKQFGAGATTKTRNQDLAMGVSSRYVNQKPASDRAKYQR